MWGFRCYIYFICRCLNDSDSPAQFVNSPIARTGNSMKIYIHYTQTILHKKAALEHSAAGLSVNFKLLPALIPFAS